MLEESLADESWLTAARSVESPFGDSRTGERITVALGEFLQPASGRAQP